MVGSVMPSVDPTPLLPSLTTPDRPPKSSTGSAPHKRRVVVGGTKQTTTTRVPTNANLAGWQSLDAYQSLATVGVNHYPPPHGHHEAHHWKRMACWSMVWRYSETMVLLALVGLLTAMATMLGNLIVGSMAPERLRIVERFDDRPALALVALTSFVIVMSLLSLFFTFAIASQAVGGGIPVVKVILSGLIAPGTLSIRVIIAKILGLACALIGGLSVGREGPSVHIAVAIADCLMRFPWFHRSRENVSKRLEILGCACAAGVASTFGTPLSGVLFSIEVTASFYMVRNLPRALFTALVATLIYAAVGFTDTFALFDEETPQDNDKNHVMAFTIYDLLCSSLLGIICGLLGGLFNTSIARLSSHRNRWLRASLPPKSLHTRRIILVVLASIMVAPIIFLDISLGMHAEDYDGPLTHAIFQTAPWPKLASLFIYTPCKFLVTVLSVTLPLPVGLFTPSFLTGGAIGRAFGEIITRYFGGPHLTFSAWQFAIIGAAAFVSGVTRTISTCVIIFELSRHHTIRLPVTAAILFAYVITNRFIKNVYDLIIDKNGVPYLPDLPEELSFVQASQVMRPISEEKFLTLKSTFEDVEDILMERKTTKDLIPVVDSVEGMHFEGVVRLKNLTDCLLAFCSRKQDMTLRDWSSLAEEAGIEKVPDEEEEDGKVVEDAVREEEDGGGRRLRRAPTLYDAIKAMEETPLNYVWLAAGQVKPYCSSSTSSSTPTPHFFSHDMDLDIVIDPSAPTHADSAFLCKVEMSFRMLKLSEAWVVRSGRLVGVISREALADFIIAREHEFRPIQRCFQLFGACAKFCCCRPDDLLLHYQRTPVLGAPLLFDYHHKRDQGESKEDEWTRQSRRLPMVV